MTHATYLRYELIRTFRNRRFLIFSLAFPLILLLTIGSANRHARLDGIPFPLYFMAGMVSWAPPWWRSSPLALVSRPSVRSVGHASFASRRSERARTSAPRSSAGM